MKQPSSRIHVDDASRHYMGKNGEQHITRCFLLRRSYRDENGKPQKETLANISDLPDSAIAGLRLLLRGATLIDVESSFNVERPVPHGDVAAAHLMARKLGLPSLLGPECREREIAYALILSRAVRPKSKSPAVRWWSQGDTTLAADLGMSDVSADDVYAAMDWLLKQQPKIERKLARRHLREGGTAMYDLSSSWVDGKNAASRRSATPVTGNAGESR